MQVQEQTPKPAAISVPEAARMLSISTRHAWKLVSTGEIASVRLGRRVLVPTQRLLAMLEAGASGGGGSASLQPGNGRPCTSPEVATPAFERTKGVADDNEACAAYRESTAPF